MYEPQFYLLLRTMLEEEETAEREAAMPARTLHEEQRSIVCQNGEHDRCQRPPKYGNPQCSCACHSSGEKADVQQR